MKAAQSVVLSVTVADGLPALIAGEGDRAVLRVLEIFTVTIHNKNTRAAYARAAADFLRWCEGQGIGALGHVQPVHVAAYVEQLQGKRSEPTVKQHLACIRMLFDWLVTGQVMPTNPAHSVRGPRHSVSKGSTPVLSSEEATALLTGMDISTVAGLRDRAIIAVMTYAFARVGAVVALTVEDYFPQKKRLVAAPPRKNGKLNEMPCHNKLEEYLDAYIKAAGVADDRKGPLFRSAVGKTRTLGPGAMSRIDVWRMVRRRAADAGIATAIGCHTFRAAGITDYLTNGGRIEVAQRMAGHSNTKTAGLYDRRNDDISVGEVERTRI
ncbi:MAG: tyrosine-type recombinase/integrase [Bryobacteraceae bacterium]